MKGLSGFTRLVSGLNAKLRPRAPVTAIFLPGCTVSEGRLFVYVQVTSLVDTPVVNVRASAFVDGKRLAASGSRNGRPARIDPRGTVCLTLRLPRPDIADLVYGEVKVRGGLTAHVSYGPGETILISWDETPVAATPPFSEPLAADAAGALA
jgi:hypothetical protein